MQNIRFIKCRCFLKSRIIVRLRKLMKKIQVKKFHPNYKFSHVTHYSCGNAGDTALSTSVRKLFDLNLGSISWNLFTMVDRVNAKTIKKFNQDDVIVIGGHGAFLPDTNANDISGWEFTCSLEQYNEITTPIIIFAVGYNYFRGQQRTELFEQNINALVRKSAFFGMRNTGSIKEVQSFVDDDLKNKIVFQPCPTTIARYIYPDLPEKKVTQKVAFNVAMDREEMRMGENKDIILDQIACSMYEIAKKGYEIHFITHLLKEIDFLPYINKYDFKYKFHSASSWDIRRLMKFYNEMDVVIGMRGHGIWIPFGVNCQIISLGTQNKTKWFLEDINAKDWLIDVMDCPGTLSQRILDKFVDIHEINGNITTKKIIEEQKKLYTITCNNMELIKKIIQS